MHVVLAPDCFTGTLTAVEAAAAMAAGWRSVRPTDTLLLRPMSDGGPGFLDALPGKHISLLVEDPVARAVRASYRLDGATAYVESAQAAGLHLLAESERNPALTTTYGVGELVADALGRGARRVVVGLGGSATNDGGAGLLAALSVRREDAQGHRLAPGGAALARAARLVGRPRTHGAMIVAATDVDNPLLGEHGATRAFGPQKGPADLIALEAALAHWADLLEAHLGVHARDRPGAGAAGGLGFALLALGAARQSGAQVVAEAIGLSAAVGGAALVLTGEGCLDVSSLRGKVVAHVAATAQDEGVPCAVVAGRVEVGARQAAAAGIDATYALVEHAPDRALTDPAAVVAEVTAQVAAQWGR